MRKRAVTLVEILERPVFQFWFFVVGSAVGYIALRLPARNELLILLAISVVWAFGILGVIYFTAHADNPYWRISIWLRATAATLAAILVPGILLGVVPAGAGLLVIPTILAVPFWQTYLLTLAFKENFLCCLWWVFGGLSLVFLTATLGTLLYSLGASLFT